MKRPAKVIVIVALASVVCIAAADENFGWRPRRAAAAVGGPHENHKDVKKKVNCTPAVPRAVWQRALFACRPDDNPRVNKLDAVPGCDVFPPKSAGGFDQLLPYRYLPPHPFPRQRSKEWRDMYTTYERWLYEGGATDAAGHVREEILFADGATAGKSVLWMSHFVTAWAVAKGEMLDERWTRKKFDGWRWGETWRLPCPEPNPSDSNEGGGGGVRPVEKGLLCVFNLGTLMSQRRRQQHVVEEVRGDSRGGDGDGGGGGGDGDGDGGDGGGGDDMVGSSSSSCADGTDGRFSFAEEALPLFRAPPAPAAGIPHGGAQSFDPYQPPPASPAAMFAASSFLRRLWARGGLAPAVRGAVEAASVAALKECLCDDGGDGGDGGGGGDRGGARGGQPSSSRPPRPFPRAVSVHVRRGDACMRWAEPGDADYAMGRPCYRTEHYVQAAEQLAEMYGATVERGGERAPRCFHD